MSLPDDADKIILGDNFDVDQTWREPGKLLTGSPLFPEKTNYQLNYFVPAKDGALELPIVAPAAVGALIVFVPADGAQVTATGLTGGDVMDTPQGKQRMYMAQGLAAGASARLSVKGIKAVAVAEADDVVAGGGVSTRNLVVGAAFLLVLVGAGLMLMKKPAAAKAE